MTLKKKKCKCTCKKCGYEWMSRVKNPKACPYCKQYDWDRKSKREEVEG